MSDIKESRTCETCHEAFRAGDWWHAGDGHKHTVARKDYFLSDTPNGRTIITNIPPGDLPADFRPGADDQHIGGSVEFIDGKFRTSDPEQQYWLDLRGGFITEEQWRQARITPDERCAMEMAEREANIARLENENAELRKKLAAKS